MADSITPTIKRTSPPQVRKNAFDNGNVATNPLDSALVTLTPETNTVLGKVGVYQVLFARTNTGGSDVIVGFDQSLNTFQTPLDVDLLFGKTQPIADQLTQDLLGTLSGNAPTGANDVYIFGDQNSSNYARNGYNDFALLATFNPNEDIIQLNGSPDDYDFVNLPVLGEAIFRKTTGSSLSVFNGDLVGVVDGAFNLDPWGANFKYVDNTAPQEPFLPQIKQIGTRGVTFATGVATDAQNNVLATGVTNGSLFGANNGSYDIWVAKYDNNGNQLWGQQFGSSKYDIANGITTDSFNNFYLVGGTEGDLVTPTQAQSQDAWLSKFDSNGKPIWAVQLGENSLSGSTNVTVDNSGNVYVSGLTVLSDTRPNSTFPTYDQSWVTKYDSNGNQQWFTQIGVALEQPAIWVESYGIALAPDGSVYSTGWTFGGLATTNSGAPGNYDAWITKFNSNTGNVEWVRQFGAGNGNEFNNTFAWSIGTDSKGNVYDYGWTQGNLNGGPITDPSDLFIAKYDSNGNQQWIKQFGATGLDNAAFLGGLKIDANDNLFVTGFTNGNINGGTNAGSYDAFVERFDTNGNQIWYTQFGTPEREESANLAFDNAGNLFVTGSTQGSLGASKAGTIDGWVAKLDKNTGNLLNFNPGTPSSVFPTTPQLPEGNFGDANGINNETDLQNFILGQLPSSSTIPVTDATSATLVGIADILRNFINAATPAG